MQHYSDVTFLKQYPLSPKKIFKKTIGGMLRLLIVSPYLYLLIFLVIGGPGHGYRAMIIFACFFIILLMPNYYYQKRYIETYYYNLTDTLLVIRKGVFAPKEITVPIRRIQDVYVDQDILDRLFDIYDVHISTATAESTARSHIDGVSKKVAEELRALILDKLHQTSGKQ